jgi:hypothetical protein
MGARDPWGKGPTCLEARWGPCGAGRTDSVADLQRLASHAPRRAKCRHVRFVRARGRQQVDQLEERDSIREDHLPVRIGIWVTRTRWKPPAAVCAVSMFARFSATIFIRDRCATRPAARISVALIPDTSGSLALPSAFPHVPVRLQSPASGALSRR